MIWFDFYGRTMLIKRNHDKFEVRVDNKQIEPLRANPLLHISKLVSYALAQLIWCSYFIQKTTIFNPTNFSSFIFKFQNSRHENDQKMLIYAQQASSIAFKGSERPVKQHQHERINQNDQRQPLKMTIVVQCLAIVVNSPVNCVRVVFISNGFDRI